MQAVGVLTGRHVDGGRKTLTSGQQRHNHGERKTLHQVATVQCGDLLLTCDLMEFSMSKLIIIPVAIGRLQNSDLNL